MLPALGLGYFLRCTSARSPILTSVPPSYSQSYNNDVKRHFHAGYSKLKVFPRNFRWLQISLGASIACYTYYHLKHRDHPPEETKKASAVTNIEISAYKSLPLNTVSRWWGWMHNLDLPMWLRGPLLQAYVSLYKCNMEEAEESDLKKYRNLGELFRRSLKSGARPIHPGNCIVSPADGEVLHLGAIEGNHVEQVKGIRYQLHAFLGPNTWTPNSNLSDYYQSLLMKGGSLYHCVIYLAPGDYHRFHSPVEWTVSNRRHFPGALLSVCPGIASWIPGLFHINERVIYTGHWQHGFFAMAPVGATNVGSIKVYFDQDLETNKRKPRKGYSDYTFSGIRLKKGDAFGEFNLGSTIVLIFEAPPGSTFEIQPGQKIKYGQMIFEEAPAAESASEAG